jgi:hypothetical protein
MCAVCLDKYIKNVCARTLKGTRTHTQKANKLETINKAIYVNLHIICMIWNVIYYETSGTFFFALYVLRLFFTSIRPTLLVSHFSFFLVFEKFISLAAFSQLIARHAVYQPFAVTQFRSDALAFFSSFTPLFLLLAVAVAVC